MDLDVARICVKAMSLENLDATHTPVQSDIILMLVVHPNTGHMKSLDYIPPSLLCSEPGHAVYLFLRFPLTTSS